MSEAEFLTPEEVAMICRVTRRTVYRWLEEGELSACRAGRGWRISRQQLEEFMNPGKSEDKTDLDVR